MEENIITRNRDVEHIVNAAMNLGHYSKGEQVDKFFGLLVMGDVHGCEWRQDRIKSMVQYLNYKEGIDAGLMLGDMEGSNFTSDAKWYTEAVNQAEKPFFTMIGNHDGGNRKVAATNGSKQQVFEKYILPVREKTGIADLDKTYYAVNFDEYKITLIMLDNYMAPDDRDENGDFVYSRGSECLNQAEVDWLIDTLKEVPSDYHVLIARHGYPDEAIKTKCDWSQEYGDIIGSNETEYGKCNLVPDVVDAWIHGKVLCREYAPLDANSTLPTLKVNADFSKRGEGVFISYLIGHVHRDVRGTASPYTEQNILCFPCSGDDTWTNGDCDLPRLPNTKAIDCLTVVAVDTKERRINMVRIGANITYKMVDRTFTTLNY